METKELPGLIVGTPIQLGSKVYVCPALNIKGMRMFKDELALLEQGVPPEKLDDREAFYDFLSKLATVTHAALARNYPSITLEQVEDGIDFNNVRVLVAGVLGASGYTTNSETEANAKLFGENGKTAMGESIGTV